MYRVTRVESSSKTSCFSCFCDFFGDRRIRSHLGSDSESLEDLLTQELLSWLERLELPSVSRLDTDVSLL